MYCRKCGSRLDDDAVICPNCGVPTDKFYTSQPYGSQQPYSPATGTRRSNGLAIAGFIVSLVSIIFGYIFCITSIVALGLSIAGMNNRKNCTDNNGFATAGLVISIITLVFWLAIWIVAIVMAAMSTVPTYPYPPYQGY